MKGKAIKIILGVLITLFLVYFFMTQISVKDILELFKRISLSLFMLGFILYALSYLVRAFRFKILLNSKLRLKQLFHIVALHTAMNNILPARTGELSYIYLITKQDIKGAKAASSLIISRIFDSITIILIFLTSIFFLENVPKVISSSLSIVYTMLFIILLLFFVLIFFGDVVVKLCKKMYNLVGGGKSKFVKRVFGIVERILDDFKLIRSRRKIVALSALSILIWLLQYSTLYVIIISSGISISVVSIIVSITLMNLSAALPIQGIGGFGTIEVSWVLGLILFGVAKEVAIPIAFFNHIIIIIYFMVLGGYSFIILNKSKNI